MRSNAKQNVYDGIVIELYIRELKKQVEVSSVKKRTYTPSKDEKIEFYSNVPNGTEYCIRLSEIITNTKEIVKNIMNKKFILTEQEIDELFDEKRSFNSFGIIVCR